MKVLEGNPGKRPLNEAEPTYAPGAGEPFAGLDDVGRAEWNRVSALLTASGVLTQADRGILTLYCEAWSRWVEAHQKLKITGKVLKSTRGLYQNPFLKIANAAADAIARYGSLLGLDPSSRGRIVAKPPAQANAKPKVRPQTHLDRLGAEG